MQLTMLTTSKLSCVLLTLSTPPPRNLKLLLDQGFPKPPGFTVHSIDRTLDVIHLSDHAPHLSAASTPDWLLLRIASRDGFDALVTRDLAQTRQLLEMYVLSRLRGFCVITWRKPIADPITEWGQLLAYLPLIKKRLRESSYSSTPGRMVLIPAPALGGDNLHNPADTIGRYAASRGISHRQARIEASAEIEEWLRTNGEDLAYFADILR
jgi:hypothetical protein